MTSSLAIPIVMFVAKDKYKHGYGVGQLDGQAHVMQFLQKHFQRSPHGAPSDPKDELCLKSGNVFVIEKLNNLTIETK